MPATSPVPPPGEGVFPAGALDSRHFADGRFFNPWGRLPVRARDVFRWYRERPWRRPPELPAPRVTNDGASLAGREPDLALTWVGHATFALHHERSVLLTDPHFGRRALLPKRHVPPGLPIAAIPDREPVAVVSHSHYDHLDRWTVRRLPRNTRWLVPLGLGRYLRAWGARDVRELDWWQAAEAGPWQLTCVPAQHWSNRLSHPRDATLWCGWVIAGGGRRTWFAGDTGWFGGIAELGRRIAPLDLALLPIGAYEPRWFMRYQHMNPAEAVSAAQAVGARRMVGMHWGTFVLTDEPLDAPPGELRRAAAATGLAGDRVLLPAVGETVRC
jgi:N-acyl-phosphatidylethanolamine-hydrolysing phospholipase D